MSTSPKIVKKSSVSELGQISFPEFRSEELELGKVLDLVVPDLEEIRIEQRNALPTNPDPLTNTPFDPGQMAVIEEAARQKAMQELEQMVEVEVENRLSEIRNTLTESIENLGSAKNEISEQIEKGLVRLALKIAEKIVGREVALDETVSLEMVKRSVKQIDRRSLAEVHLNPDDFSFIQQKQNEIDFHGSIKLIEDQSISKGGCLVHTDTGDFDATIESQFEEIVEGLLVT